MIEFIDETKDIVKKIFDTYFDADSIVYELHYMMPVDMALIEIFRFHREDMESLMLSIIDTLKVHNYKNYGEFSGEIVFQFQKLFRQACPIDPEVRNNPKGGQDVLSLNAVVWSLLNAKNTLFNSVEHEISNSKHINHWK